MTAHTTPPYQRQCQPANNDVPDSNEAFKISMARQQASILEERAANFTECKLRIGEAFKKGYFMVSCKLTSETVDYFRKKGYGIIPQSGKYDALNGITHEVSWDLRSEK